MYNYLYHLVSYFMRTLTCIIDIIPSTIEAKLVCYKDKNAAVSIQYTTVHLSVGLLFGIVDTVLLNFVTWFDLMTSI